MTYFERADAETLTRRDHVIGAALAGGLFVYLLVTAAWRARHLLLSYDMAYFTQAAWLIGQGENPFSTIRALHLLGDHTNYILWPLGYLGRLIPLHPLFLGVQAAALAGGAVFVYLLARRVASAPRGLAVGLVVAYALFPALHNVNIADFHPDTLALPALLGSVYFSLMRRWRLYALSVLVALACREDIALPVIVLGVMLVFSQRRWAGILTVVAATVLLAVNLFVVLPAFAGADYEQAAKFGAFGNSLPDIARNVVLHPFTVLDALTSGENLQTLIKLFGPVLFLCFLAPRWLLPGLPLQGVYMLSTVEAAHTIDYHYNVVVTAFIFAAAAVGLRRLAATARLAIPLVMSGVLFWWAFGLDANLWFREPPTRGPLESALSAAAPLVRPGDAVLVSDRTAQFVSERKSLYLLGYFLSGDYRPPQDPVPYDQRRADLDVIFVDTADPWQWDDKRQRLLDDFVSTGTWQRVFDREGVLVFRRA